MSEAIQSAATNGNFTVVRQPLTPKQLKVYRRIERLIAAKPYGPSFREIGRACNLSSTKTVSDYIKQLEAKGWLKRIEGATARALQLTEPERAA
jgi:SOS-response transcriptional repressor LexA